MDSATLTLSDEQRRKLAQVYAFLLSLSKQRKAKTADAETPTGEPSAGSDPDDGLKTEVIASVGGA